MFFVLISSRKKIIVLFILIIICGLFFFKDDLTKHYCGAKKDVILLQQNMGGQTREKVNEIVAARYGEWRLSPVDAFYEKHTNQIIPELWGYEVNIQETVNKIMAAPEGQHVFPVYNTIFPEIALEDYPSAIVARGNPAKKQISFMINVAWGNEYILPMLEVLAKESAGASFFLVGKWAEQNKKLLREISSRGHLLENHGHTDSLVYTELSKEEMEQGLQKVNALIYAVTGKNPLFFTPHKGEYNDLVLEVVSRQGMRTVLWSIDTVDWNTPGVEKMETKILENLHEGAIVLMHPTADTVILLENIIPVIKNKGFKIVTIAELLNPYYPPNIGE